jgi:hypothetical protein
MDEPYDPDKDEQPTPVVVVHERGWRKKLLWGAILVILLAAVGAGSWWLGVHHGSKDKSVATTKTRSTTSTTAQASTNGQLTLDKAKGYGDKYADGLLPVGDGKYKSDQAQKGYVYTCSTYASNFSTDKGGAGSRGPWFTNNNTQYDLNKKAHIAGSVAWQSSFANSVTGSTRTITTNDLPEHHTGVFPVAASDPAHQYDANPNSIKSQTLSYSLAASPAYGDPQCMGGQAGVMLTGVALFNGFDAGGRDAGAWEVRDSCSGHPEKQGEYHYHTLSSCITDTGVQTVIGFALDGFPITGPKVGTNNILTTDDLDVCHGITSQINLDGKPVTMYHYVMTQDFPYSVSCFRATASNPPGMPSGGQQSGPANVPPRY